MRDELKIRLEEFKKLYSVDAPAQGRVAQPPVAFIGEEFRTAARRKCFIVRGKGHRKKYIGGQSGVAVCQALL